MLKKLVGYVFGIYWTARLGKSIGHLWYFVIYCILRDILDREIEKKYWVLTKLRLLRASWLLLETNTFQDIFIFFACTLSLLLHTIITILLDHYCLVLGTLYHFERCNHILQRLVVLLATFLLYEFYVDRLSLFYIC